jgi:multidrug resistance efflux pump
MKNIRNSSSFNWYTILWLIAVGIVLYLYYNWQIDKNYLGIVERKAHLLGAQESGRIKSIFVTIGSQVQKDQVIAVLDVSDLKTHLSNLRREFDQIQNLSRAQTNEYALQIERWKVELDNDALALLDRLSTIESKSAELASLNNQIKRLQDAGSAGLGYNRDLVGLIIQRDALESYLREQSKILKDQDQRIAAARQSRKFLESANIDSISKSMLLERLERAEDLRREIDATEYRLHLRTIVAPCDGYVTELLASTGDVVEEFIPFITVEEIKPSYLVVYIPEKDRLKVEPGMPVKIYSTRNKHYNSSAVVTFVHPGFSQADPRLSFRSQIFWARKVHVELKPDHNLVPGEMVYVRINGRNHFKNKNSASTSAYGNSPLKNEHNPAEHPALDRMTIPQSLLHMSRFEPSGVIWLSDIHKFLIVSDDTGIKDKPNDHAPYLFLMSESGQVEPEPVVLRGIESVNDLEGITAAEEGVYYAISSQNISKKGNRPTNREYLLKITRTGSQFEVQGKINFLSLIQRSYSQAQLHALGLGQDESDHQPVLNIEGIAWFDHTLYLGLKQPTTDQGAIIWQLIDLDNAFQDQELQPNQLKLYGVVALNEHPKIQPGISDLFIDKSGVMWSLSTIPDADKNNQYGGFHRIDHFDDGRLEAQRIFSFPGLKPEGLCQLSEQQFLIVFDTDTEIPYFCYARVEN